MGVVPTDPGFHHDFDTSHRPHPGRSRGGSRHSRPVCRQLVSGDHLHHAAANGLRLSLEVATLPPTLQIRIPSLGMSFRGTVVWLRRTAALPARFLCGVEVTGGPDAPGWSCQQLLNSTRRP